MKSTGNKTTTIALTVFALLAFLGFAFPIFATSLPGAQIVQTKITVGDTTQPFAIADTNYLQGGHMQVATTTEMFAITPQRRSVGMLVSVVSSSTVTYRLIRNPIGGSGCPGSTSYVTDNSIDGLDEPSSCTTTTSTDWRIVIPDLSTATSGMLMQTDGNGNATIGAGIVTIFSDTAFTVTTTGVCSITSPCVALNMAHTNTWTASQIFAGGASFAGVVNFASSTSIVFPFTAGKYGLWWTNPSGVLQRFDWTAASSSAGLDVMVNPNGDGLMVAGDYGGYINTGTYIPGINSQTITGSSVRDFLNKIFFRSAPPAINTLGTQTLELGSATSSTVSFTVTRGTGAVTSLTMSATTTTASDPMITSSSTDSPSSTLTPSLITATSTYTSTLGTGGSSGSTYSFLRNVTLCTTAYCNLYNGTMAKFIGYVSDGVSTLNGSKTYTYYPPVYWGATTTDFMNSTAFPDDASASTTSLYSGVLASLTPHALASRATGAQTFTYSTPGQYVYFAFPSYDTTSADATTSHYGPFLTYDPSASLASSCVSTTNPVFGGGGMTGTAECFYDSVTTSLDHSFYHRTMHRFSTGNGLQISYELYRALSPLSPGTTLYGVQ